MGWCQRLSLLLVSYCVNYCQSTDTGNETCRDRGVLGRIERNTKSCVVDQQSTLETVMEKLETLQSLLGGQQQEQQANVCELKLYNAALNQPAYQSSVYQDIHPASLANDGSRNTNAHSGTRCALTNVDTNPWWAVDLGRPTTVCKVFFTNRGDGWEHRSNNFIVGLTNVSPESSTPTLWDYTLCGQYPGSVPAGARVPLDCPNHIGQFRYVIVQFPMTDHMNFCEFEVMAPDTREPTIPTTPMPPCATPTTSLGSCSLTATVSECEEAGFTYVESVNGCYKVVSENLDLDASTAKCRSFHQAAHLVMLENLAENAAVGQVVDSVDTTGCFEWGGYGSYLRTAGQRLDPTTASKYIWKIPAPADPCHDEHVIDMTFNNWASGQPDFSSYSAPDKESTMNLCKNHEYKWNDVAPSQEMCFVCEISLD